MDMPDRDVKGSKPRICSDNINSNNAAFYPSRHHPLHLPSMAAGSGVPTPRRPGSGEDESEDEDLKRTAVEPTPAFSSADSHHSSSSSNSPIPRKRKSSWPTSGVEKGRATAHDDEYDERRPREETLVRPIVSSSSGMPAGERLPGIAHLDKQMHTPWSVSNARRGQGANDEDLRRLSSRTYPASRSLRSSLHDSFSSSSRGEVTLPSFLHSSPRALASSRRPSSPVHGSYDNEQGRLHSSYQSSAEGLSLSRGASPLLNGAPAFAQRSPFEPDSMPAYRRKHPSEWSEDRFSSGPAAPPHLPSPSSWFDERRRQPGLTASLPLPLDRSEDFHRHSTGREKRGRYSAERAEYAYGSSSQQHRDMIEGSRSSYPYDMSKSTSTLGAERGGYGAHRQHDRDSPGFYGDEGGRGPTRMENSSPRHHPYPLNANTSPSVPRRRGKLPKVVTDLLKTWLLDHASHPYPTEDEKRRLCSVTGLSISQVSNWFINARRRILVPQGSGSFALGHPGQHSSGSGGPPPSHGGHPHRSPPPSPSLMHHHHIHHHAHQQHNLHTPSLHHDDSIHHMYRRGSSHSPRHLSRHTEDDAH